MKDVEYRPSWSTNKDSDMADKFGKLLHETDTADAYEVAESMLFFNGKKYYWLQANGCSCWDGDYYGWELTKLQLIKLAKARSKDEDGYRGSDHDKLMGQWIVENIK
jgi:hypothetical protein